MRQYNVAQCHVYDRANKRECIDQNARRTAMAFTSKVNKEHALALYNSGIKTKDIAATYGVQPCAISQLVKRAKEAAAATAEYRDNKAQVFEHIQGKLLSAVSADDPKSAQQLVTSAAILEDKIRLERGQATVNTTVDICMLIASLPNSTPDNTESC